MPDGDSDIIYYGDKYEGGDYISFFESGIDKLHMKSSGFDNFGTGTLTEGVNFFTFGPGEDLPDKGFDYFALKDDGDGFAGGGTLYFYDNGIFSLPDYEREICEFSGVSTDNPDDSDIEIV